MALARAHACAGSGRESLLNLRSLAPQFSTAAGHASVNWPLTMMALKRLVTALPWLEEQDFVRIAKMARIEAGKPVPLMQLTPKNARRLYELAVATQDGQTYDQHESPATGRIYHSLLKRGHAP